jgi:hypothetical protein
MAMEMEPTLKAEIRKTQLEDEKAKGDTTTYKGEQDQRFH